LASFGHVAIGMALGRAWDPSARARGRFAAAVLLSGLALLPDADVIAFPLGIPYAHPFGHRGASHSLFAAAVLAGVLALALRPILPFARAAAFAFLALASHGVLDAFTDGGLGIALAWPFTADRFFAPIQPIPVAPLGAGMWSARGLYVIAFELVLFAPLIAYGLWPQTERVQNASRRRPDGT
jgi:inner membrane protein